MPGREWMGKRAWQKKDRMNTMPGAGKQERRSQNGSGRAPGSQDPWEEVCRSMNELGTTVATEVGRGLKEGWDQVQKSLNEAQAIGNRASSGRNRCGLRPRYPPLQGTADAAVNRAVARVDRAVDRLGETMANGLCMMGGTVATGCAVVLGLFGILIFVGGFMSGIPEVIATDVVLSL